MPMPGFRASRKRKCKDDQYSFARATDAEKESASMTWTLLAGPLTGM